MNKLLLIVLLLFPFIFFTSCTTVKYVTVPLSEPPKPYKIEMGQIRTQKQLFKEYQKCRCED